MQSAAFEAADSAPNASDLAVMSRETRAGGKREFIVCTEGEFWRQYQLSPTRQCEGQASGLDTRVRPLTHATPCSPQEALLRNHPRGPPLPPVPRSGVSLCPQSGRRRRRPRRPPAGRDRNLPRALVRHSVRSGARARPGLDDGAQVQSPPRLSPARRRTLHRQPARRPVLAQRARRLPPSAGSCCPRAESPGGLVTRRVATRRESLPRPTRGRRRGFASCG